MQKRMLYVKLEIPRATRVPFLVLALRAQSSRFALDPRASRSRFALDPCAPNSRLALLLVFRAVHVELWLEKFLAVLL